MRLLMISTGTLPQKTCSRRATNRCAFHLKALPQCILSPSNMYDWTLFLSIIVQDWVGWAGDWTRWPSVQSGQGSYVPSSRRRIILWSRVILNECLVCSQNASRVEMECQVVESTNVLGLVVWAFAFGAALTKMGTRGQIFRKNMAAFNEFSRKWLQLTLRWRNIRQSYLLLRCSFCSGM